MPTPGLPSGDDYAIVYSADDVIGIDARPSVSAVFADGNLTSYTAGDMERLALGAATALSGHTATYAWGLWSGGPTMGVWYAAKPSGDFTFTPGGGFHFAIGKRTDPSVLTGGSDYDYQAADSRFGGATTPTIEGATSGLVSLAQVSCSFTDKTCNVSLTGTVDGSALAINEKATFATAKGAQFRSASTAGLFVGGRFGGIVMAYVVNVGGKTARGAVALQYHDPK